MSTRTWKSLERAAIALALVVSLASLAGIVYAAGMQTERINGNAEAIVELKATQVRDRDLTRHQLDRVEDGMDRIEDSVNQLRHFLMGIPPNEADPTRDRSAGPDRLQ